MVIRRISQISIIGVGPIVILWECGIMPGNELNRRGFILSRFVSAFLAFVVL